MRAIIFSNDILYYRWRASLEEALGGEELLGGGDLVGLLRGHLRLLDVGAPLDQVLLVIPEEVVDQAQRARRHLHTAHLAMGGQVTFLHAALLYTKFSMDKHYMR